MEKVLISGVTGFVGSHLCDYILENFSTVEIHGLKRWRSPLENISHILDKLTLYDCDLTDLSAVFSVFKTNKFDKVFHLAAQSFVPYSYANPIATLQTNVLGTANLLEAIRLSGQSPLIHICSSSEVYGQPVYTPIDEKHPLNPISPYGVSKVAEDMLGWQYYKAYGMKIVRTRAFTHTGARRGDVFAESNFAKQIAILEKSKVKELELYAGNISSIRSWCDIRDMVRAYWMLSEGMVGEVYNIGGGEIASIRDIIDRLLHISMVDTPNLLILGEQERYRPIDVTLQIPDCSKFKEATGWQPEILLEQTMASLLNFWRQHV